MRYAPLVALTLLTLLAFLSAGCVHADHRLVLDPVGPSPIQSSASGANGSLVVFSAFDPHAHFNGYPYRRYYAGYKIFSNDGELLRRIQNDNGRLAAGPARVTLPPDTYRVVASANGFGEVVVPVVIAAYQVTTVHLDGGARSPDSSTPASSNPVRLPDGEIVGWRTAGGPIAP
jgi:hypothetical protein